MTRPTRPTDPRTEAPVDWAAVRAHAPACAACGLPVDTSDDGFGLPPIRRRGRWYCDRVCEADAAIDADEAAETAFRRRLARA